MGAVVVQGDHVAIDALLQHHGAPAAANVLPYERVCGIHRHVTQVLGFRVIGHSQAKIIVRIEHRRVLRDLDRNPLQLGQLLQGIDAL